MLIYNSQKDFFMAIFILVIFLTFSLVGCGGDNRSEKTAAENLTSVYQLNDKRYVIGFGEGSSAANILHQELPNAKAKSYNDELTGYESVKQGKIDGYLSERIQMQMAIRSAAGRTGTCITFARRTDHSTAQASTVPQDV